jgi:GNAT superfamily N-acetyltransferase
VRVRPRSGCDTGEVEARIVHIGEVPAVAPMLARWHAREWGHLYAPSVWNEETALDEFTEQMAHGCTDAGAQGSPPATFVALAAASDTPTVVGSVSIVDGDDLDGFEHLGPWLASLFVPPEHRRLGIGTRLVTHVMTTARRLSIERLHLFTADRVAWYESLGWIVLTTARANREPVTVMYVDLVPAQD